MMVAVEALLRWPQPDGSLRPPVSFIPDVERHSRRLMVALRPLRCCSSALAQAAAWHRQGHPIAVSVNVSAREFLEEGFRQPSPNCWPITATCRASG